MKIGELISEDSIIIASPLKTKDEVSRLLAERHKELGNIRDEGSFMQAIKAREAEGTTAVGGGIAIPHAKSAAVRRAGICAATLSEGADWGSPDGVCARLVFMIAAPPEGDKHLEVLSRLVTMLMDKKLSEALTNAASPAEFLRLLCEREDEKRKDSTEEGTLSDFPEIESDIPSFHAGKYRVLAVTSCPTGIAHTYMAAEALRKAGEELDIPIKVETDGSGGAKNVLTEREIKDAEAIIIAADRQVEAARFDGCRVIFRPVADGIHKPEELLLTSISGKVPVYHHNAKRGGEKQSSTAGATGWRAIYAYLMNGVSHMLPFVVAGGIFIALAFLIDTASGAPADALFGSHTAAAAFVKSIGSIVFSFMLPVLSGYIAVAVADRPAFLPGFAGGWLASLGSTFSSPEGAVSSGFLGALFAGFAAGFLMLMLEALCEHFPAPLEGIKPVLVYPLVGLALITAVMCGVNPLMGVINEGVASLLTSMGSISAVVLGAVLGAMMAIDMGGPFNKAAYVFGTASIATGNYKVMAAVMAGGMVPPLAIALATTFFGRKFSPEEKRSGAVNYILGLSFITEGAIPYAASDPVRVIPSCMVGAAVAGGISTAAGCTLSAPHGGIFVFPVVGQWYFYLAAIAVGALVGMALLAALKKDYRPVKKAAK